MIPLKEMKEFHEKHRKLIGLMPLTLGAVILLNYYFFKLPWFVVFGWLLVLIGLTKIIVHKYCCKNKKK